MSLIWANIMSADWWLEKGESHALSLGDSIGIQNLTGVIHAFHGW